MKFKNVFNLQKTLQEKGWDLLLIEDPLDLFYLTGLKLSAGLLCVFPEGALLFVDGRYLEMAKKQKEVAVALFSDQALKHFILQRKPKKIVFDGKKVSYERFLELQEKCTAPLVSEGLFLRTLRGIKAKEEIRKLVTSAKLLYQGFLHLKSKMKVGIEEQELASLFELFCLKKGAEALSFPPIIAFGAHSALPHYRAGSGKLKKNQIVLCDLGVCIDGYHSDMTRTFFFGKHDPFLQRAFDIVKEAKAKALTLLKPKTKVSALDEAVFQVFEAYGVEAHYLHSLGHGVGLEIHEFPKIRRVGEDQDCLLEEGMVVTIEPGLYFSGKGGIRDEDTYVVTKTGYRQITT